MSEFMRHIIDHMPFVAGTTAGAPVHWSGQRLVEALIIAVATAGLTGFVSIKVVETRVDAIEKRIEALHQDVRELRATQQKQGVK